jgi:putative Mn2+ efflux pump MntP
MALTHCKVCGSLTSAETEICMICGYPRQGKKIPIWVKWVAYFLILIFGLPLILSFFWQSNFEEFQRKKKRFQYPETTAFSINTKQESFTNN